MTYKSKISRINIFLLMIMLASSVNAGINKCKVDGKTIYTEANCPPDSSKIDFKVKHSESIDLKYEYQGKWYKTVQQRVSFYSKYEEPYDGVNPVVYTTVHSGSFSSPESMFKPVESYLRSPQMKNVEIFPEITTTDVAGYKAYHRKAEYSFTQEGKSYDAVSDFWMIPRGKNAVMVTFTTEQNNPSLGRDEAMKITSSLKFVE